MKALTFSTWLLFACGSLLGAEEPKVPPDRVLGSVHGKNITAADVQLTAPIDAAVQFDSRDTAHWEQMGRIMSAFGQPIIERFAKERKIEATADEIKRFNSRMDSMNKQNFREWEATLAELKVKLAAPDLSDEEKIKLKDEQKMYESLLSTKVEPPEDDEIARTFIQAWKFERELHRVYGGRVIFQQFGLEALDGRRKLFEEAEKKGNLKFDDPGVRHMFYYYANMKHTGGNYDAKDLEKPWFFEEEK